MSIAYLSPRQQAEHVALMRGRDTRPEMHVRAFLADVGVTFETYVETLPGVPDVVVRDRKVAVFVHGCFWHTHGCRRTKPKISREFWETKFAARIAADRDAAVALRAEGWRVLTVWECEARARGCRSRLLRALAPSRRICHNCSNVAAIDYAMCVRCYRRVRDKSARGPYRSRGQEGDVQRRRRRRRLKLCTSCGMPARDDGVMCPAHAGSRNERSGRDTHRRLEAQGLCRCRSPLKPGFKRCDKCLRKLRREAKKRNLRYKRENRCRRCPLPPAPGLIHCAEHHAKASASAKKAMARFIKKRRDAQQCVSCGEPSPTYNCTKCRKRIANRTKKKAVV